MYTDQFKSLISNSIKNGDFSIGYGNDRIVVQDRTIGIIDNSLYIDPEFTDSLKALTDEKVWFPDPTLRGGNIDLGKDVFDIVKNALDMKFTISTETKTVNCTVKSKSIQSGLVQLVINNYAQNIITDGDIWDTFKENQVANDLQKELNDLLKFETKVEITNSNGSDISGNVYVKVNEEFVVVNFDLIISGKEYSKF